MLLNMLDHTSRVRRKQAENCVFKGIVLNRGSSKELSINQALRAEDVFLLDISGGNPMTNDFIVPIPMFAGQMFFFCNAELCSSLEY